MARKRQINLEQISEENLLKLKIFELPLSIEGTWLRECVDQLYDELAQKGIDFKPPCYLADEWLTPEGETCIGIPFYLAHPTLIHLEKKMMMEAEGETKQWCMKLLRHEAGHALCYAYRFHNRKRWAKTFGAPTAEYKDYYKFRPYSKSYVRHLEGCYAQYHPEEDFVETFAVWLSPNSNWQQKYKGWRAYKKLHYVDKLMNEIKGRKPHNSSAHKFWRLSSLRSTLANHYKRKKHFWAEEYPNFHDPFLNKVFVTLDKQTIKQPRAYKLIMNNRRDILNNVAKFSGERKYIVGDILKNLQKRARQLKVVTSANEHKDLINVTSYVTSLCMNYRYTGQYRGEKKKRA